MDDRFGKRAKRFLCGLLAFVVFAGYLPNLSVFAMDGQDGGTETAPAVSAAEPAEPLPPASAAEPAPEPAEAPEEPAAAGDTELAEDGEPTEEPSLAGDEEPAEEPAPTGDEEPAEQPAPTGDEEPAEQPAPTENEEPAEQPAPAEDEEPAEQPGEGPAPDAGEAKAGGPDASPAGEADPEQADALTLEELEAMAAALPAPGEVTADNAETTHGAAGADPAGAFGPWTGRGPLGRELCKAHCPVCCCGSGPHRQNTGRAPDAGF